MGLLTVYVNDHSPTYSRSNAIIIINDVPIPYRSLECSLL